MSTNSQGTKTVEGDPEDGGLPAFAFAFPDHLDNALRSVIGVMRLGALEQRWIRTDLASEADLDETSARAACDFLQEFGFVGQRPEVVRPEPENDPGIRWWVELTAPAWHVFTGPEYAGL